jgi:hypothetical protein
MRSPVTTEKLRQFMKDIGRMSKGPGRVYLVGGSTALLLGIREQTIDVDIKIDPEPLGIFEAIASIKESLQLNIEIASPDQFIPPIPGWRQRSVFIGKEGQVEFYHYDFYGQALAKILRGHRSDLTDATALVEGGMVDSSKLKECFSEIRHDLIRYPAVNAERFESRLEAFVEGLGR